MLEPSNESFLSVLYLYFLVCLSPFDKLRELGTPFNKIRGHGTRPSTRSGDSTSTRLGNNTVIELVEMLFFLCVFVCFRVFRGYSFFFIVHDLQIFLISSLKSLLLRIALLDFI